MGPLTGGFFSVVNTAVLCSLKLVESPGAELYIPGLTRKQYRLLIVQRVGTPIPHIVQGSTVGLPRWYSG